MSRSKRTLLQRGSCDFGLSDDVCRALIRSWLLEMPYQDMGNTENAPISTAGRRPFRDQIKKFNNTLDLASNQNEEHAVNAFDSDGLLEICSPGNISTAYSFLKVKVQNG